MTRDLFTDLRKGLASLGDKTGIKKLKKQRLKEDYGLIILWKKTNQAVYSLESDFGRELI